MAAAAKYFVVKFIEDGEKMIAECKDFKKIDINEIKLNKAYNVKYRDGHYYKAQIIAFGETKEEINNLVETRRLNVLPSKLLIDTQTCLSSEDEENQENRVYDKPTKNKKSQNSSNFRRVLGNIIQHEADDNDICDKPAKNKSQNEYLLKELQSKNLELQSKNLELQSKNLELQSKNLELQTTIIDKFKDLELFLNEPKSSECKENVIGQRKNGQVYIGNGIFLQELIYDKINNKGPKKDGLFIKEMATAIFGEDTLMKSSVTGAPSNRFHKAAKPPLDPTKISVICGILKHRLQQRGAKEEEINKIISSVNQKIGEKIQDLNRNRKRKEEECHQNEEQLARVDENNDEEIYSQEEDEISLRDEIEQTENLLLTN